MMLIAGVITSCSDEQKNNHINSKSYEGASLVLNYSGAPMLGKNATVDFYEQSVNINILGAVIPNLQFISLGSVPYTGTENDFTFEGSTELEGSTVAFTGNVKSGVCTLNLTYELEDQSLADTWYLEFAGSYDSWGYEFEKLPLDFVWESTSEGIEIDLGFAVMTLPISDIVDMVNPLASLMIIKETAGINLNADGNIQAMDSLGVVIPAPNAAIYKVEDTETIKVLLQIGNIIAEATKPQPETKSNILASVVDMAKNGIDVKYTKTGDDQLMLTFVITEEMRGLIISVLPTLSGLITGDLAALIQGAIPSVIDALSKTTKMELNLKLNTTQSFLVITGDDETKAKALSFEQMLKNALSPYMAK